ncbi:Sialidase precursor [Caulifigura coniformis]|uniref:Sialidase n=1 Tax=Caulifigura coniformis TaxID=2527983 RepID=A0A517S8U9_9PLAN|nr:sialidase family protein [Caulifigura coniformis]QDT52555.1 Sialidase precursor [Caulifigura coniformis]
MLNIPRLFTVLACFLAGGVSNAAEPAYRSELIFPLRGEHNHAPGIAELADGELVVSWYRGSGERRADDVAVFGSRLKPGAKEWTPAAMWVDTPGFPDCNTCLMTDARGRLWLFWPVVIANSWESAITHYLVSDRPAGDGAPQWNSNGVILLKPDDFQAPATKTLDDIVAAAGPLPDRTQEVVKSVKERLGDKLYQRLGWQPRCKPTVLPSGRILLPLYSDTYSLSLMAISDDGGATWFSGKPTLGFGAIQPSVVRRDDGTLVAFLRENGFSGKVRITESKDDGVSWGDVTSADLPNPGSGLDAVRLKSGKWLLVYNDTTKGRNSLAVSLSKDEGRTWTATRHLEKQPEGSFHYPTVIQSRDGMIHCVYSYFVDGGKSMKHAAFNEEWIEAGD